MTATHYERLAGLDATFLDLEADPASHMHVGMVALFEGPPPAYADLCRFIASRLDRVPRYRQSLRFVPLGQGRPVWVDEPHFDLEYHLRHSALPAPGGPAQLAALAGRLFSQRLDRGKPLWEMYFVEGVGEGRFALIAKTHHCMIDGISGVDIATVLMEPQPDERIGEVLPWTPRPSPGQAELLAESLAAQVTHPIQLIRGALDGSSAAQRTLLEIAGGIPELLGMASWGQAPASSLNAPIGPHRRFHTVQLDLGAVKRAREAGATGSPGDGPRPTVNDVILAVVAGGLRELLASRGEIPPETLRVMIPVSIRSPAARGTLGNQVTAIFCHLPVGEPDPLRRLQRIGAETRHLKEGRQAIGALALTRLSEFTPPTLAAQAARLQASSRFFNLVVTNVPGPQHALYLLGRRMLASYPCVPLVKLSTLGIALLSYDGQIGVGLLGDSDRARDLPVLADALRRALDELLALAA